jgi:hypothetical protein
MPAHKDSVYIMGTTDEEYERLRRQAALFERFAVSAFGSTRAYFHWR